MAPKTDRDSGEEVLREYSQGIAELLASAANPARVKLLALMLKGDGRFSSMTAKTGLSKTALANHLSRLTASGLVKRSSRGVYELTVDGRELLGAAVSMYMTSVKRAESEKTRIHSRYRRAFMDAESAGRRMVSNPARYQECWLSYTGAMAGCLTSLGSRCDTTDIGGASGYCFIINVAKGRLCPSGPTAIHVTTFREMLKATESFGWRIEPYIYQHAYPAKEGAPTPRELELVSRLYERVRKEVDQDRPVVLWGLAAPEYGIVNGYEEQSYIVSTFRSCLSGGKPEPPVPFHALNAPGCIDAFYFRKGERTSDDGAFVEEALSRGFRFASADMPTVKGYIAGPGAYDEWARVLLESTGDDQDYLGNSYTVACVAEGRAMSSAYLRRIAPSVSSTRREHLVEASSAYERAARELDGLAKLFPFKFQGEMTGADKRQGEKMLGRARAHEEDAVRRLAKAVG